jgi:hypothetical protein
MHNILFNVRTMALLLDDFCFAVFVGTVGSRATAERQMRLEFVRDLPLHKVTRIAAQQNYATVYRSRTC